MATKFDGHAFTREVYLSATPSVDLDEVTSENPIKASNYRIGYSVYDAILRKYGVLDENNKVINSDWNVATAMWMLDCGPSLYDDNQTSRIA